MKLLVMRNVVLYRPTSLSTDLPVRHEINKRIKIIIGNLKERGEFVCFFLKKNGT